MKDAPTKMYFLLGPDGKLYQSSVPGTLGGHRGRKVYGRFDCPSALRALRAGGYTKGRVFFANEAAAVAAGYRPCAKCMPAEYERWKRSN
jgi:hypothetical protein